jgi:subtilisin family serine protease
MEKPIFTLADFVVEGEYSPETVKDVVDWGIHEIHAEDAWQKTKGKGVKVGILDTGVDYNHPDLKDNIKAYVDFTNSPFGALDQQGHGTHVAGIIAAEMNHLGIIGVAPEAELYCAKVLGDHGTGGFDSIIKGLEWAIEQGVDIISMSLGCSMEPPQELNDAIKKASDAGIILIAATGNENSDVDWPAAYDEVIAVSAMDHNHERARFSNYGIKNEIMAPGVDILSTYKNGGYARLSGTSMATPIVSGCVALYLSYLKANNQPKPTLEELHKKLLESADDLGDPGRDPVYGDGLIDLDKLLA